MKDVYHSSWLHSLDTLRSQLSTLHTPFPVLTSIFLFSLLIGYSHESHNNDGKGPAKSDINNLIKHIGDRKIVYGFVDVDKAGRGHQEMHLQQSNSPSVPPSPQTQQSPVLQITSPPMSPALSQGETSRVRKRKSVRLAMGRPELVRPTSMVVPL